MTSLNNHELGAYYVKLVIGEDDWKYYRQKYDKLLEYRNRIKGKPTLEEKIQLLCNNCDIEWLDTYLYHSSLLGSKCACGKCSRKHITNYKPTFQKLQEFLTIENIAKYLE